MIKSLDSKRVGVECDQLFSTRIVGELLTFANNDNIFATTRADERVMSFASDYRFRINGKPYPSGHGYDLILYVRDAVPSPDAGLAQPV